jgi:hypothetical protein
MSSISEHFESVARYTLPRNIQFGSQAIGNIFVGHRVWYPNSNVFVKLTSIQRSGIPMFSPCVTTKQEIEMRHPTYSKQLVTPTDVLAKEYDKVVEHPAYLVKKEGKWCIPLLSLVLDSLYNPLIVYFDIVDINDETKQEDTSICLISMGYGLLVEL